MQSVFQFAQRCLVGNRSGLCAGYSRSSASTLAKHVFQELTLCTGALSNLEHSKHRHYIQLFASDFVATIWRTTTYGCDSHMFTYFWPYSVNSYKHKQDDFEC